MMLFDETTVPEAALPVQAMKDHLRLGSGFADDGLQDGMLVAHLRAAMAAIEGRIGKVLIQRRFRWVLENWRGGASQALPVAPVVALVSVTLRAADGDAVVVDPGRYRLVTDLHRPKIAGLSGALPVVPTDGQVEVVFDAGFGAGWADVPPDLAQAVLLLAAEFYERRHDLMQGEAGLPAGVVRLIERWRTVRIIGGGRR
jgi:uncharacterized phiE125 gp8 family phage protein